MAFQLYNFQPLVKNNSLYKDTFFKKDEYAVMKKSCFAIMGILYISVGLFLFPTMHQAEQEKSEDEQTIIIEVDGDVAENKEFIEKNHPYIEVVATYDTIFNGIALKAPKKKLQKVGDEEFIKAIHPARTYELPSPQTTDDKHQESDDTSQAGPLMGHKFSFREAPDMLEKASDDSLANLPSTLNNTTFTGKDIKVGVIDTGIDYTHPDLQANYRGGYDVVDLDDDPMETEGSPLEETFHGTHVAGTIAADGNIQGVAPDAEIYAYRALGPGGQGSTVQVLAALEKAVKDDVDIINLSLGNSVNGPDYPTSLAVNRAVEHGVTVVIASGNDGPDKWTVGSPATASNAITVGASAPPMQTAVLHEGKHDQTIAVESFSDSVPWDLEKDYEVAEMKDEDSTMQGKIALFKRGEVPFYKMAEEAEEQGAEAVLIYNNEDGTFQGSVENEEDPLHIPVASISKEDGEWLKKHMEEETLYLDTDYEESELQVADFSSRGPVTLNWAIKPDTLAPGVNIMSTVPEGYGMLEGTSMATPHVTGVIALLKEAHPDWLPEQLKTAVETTSTPIKQEEDTLYEPSTQGLGLIEPKDAIQTPALIDEPSLAFGKITKGDARKRADMTITNTSDSEQQYSFEIPEKEQGIMWDLPQTFRLNAGENKTVELEMRAMPAVLEEGVHQGYLTLKEKQNTYDLPYLFLNKTADYPKAMGFEFSLKELSDDTYQYQLYLTDAAKKVTVDLYDADTLIYKRSLLTLEDIETGMNEGEMKKRDVGEGGYYKAIITAELKDGTLESYETEVAF